MPAPAAWRRPALLFCLVAVTATGCDLSTKSWAVSALSGRGSSISVVDPYVELTLAYNRGTAFSFVRDLGDASWLLAGLALVIAVGLMVVAVRRRPVHLREVIAMALLAGGALGNGYDRAFRITPTGDTAVVDFIGVGLSQTLRWPTFNLADAWIALGVAWLVWISLRTRPEPDATATTTATADQS